VETCPAKQFCNWINSHPMRGRKRIICWSDGSRTSPTTMISRRRPPPRPRPPTIPAWIA